MKKVFLWVIFATAPFVLSGCIGDLEELFCMLMSNGDHCYQGAAVQEGDPTGCEKISGEDFADIGSNPPKDKCYLQIAENTGDLSACDKIKGGPMSYTREECILSASILNENPSGCKMLTGPAKQSCTAQFASKIDPYKVLEVDDAIQNLKDALKNGSDPDLDKQLKGLEEKRKDMIEVMTKNNQAEYTKLADPINREIAGDFATGEFDGALKEKLIAFNENLKKQGLKMTDEQYSAVKDYYKFVNDPKNDIEQMDDSQIVKDRWNEKVGNVVDAVKFWKTKPTEEEKDLDEQLRFYQRMMERQAAISKGATELQEDFERNTDMVFNAGADKAKDAIKDKVIETIFGEMTGKAASITTAVVGEALNEAMSTAKSMEFRGLVKAYDQGMAEEIGKFNGDVEKAHAEVVKKLSADAYTYAEGDSFAKYGNLLENKDCDGTNPHCIKRDVFWKAMKKSYKYQNQ
jgi:hypothetical protein